MNRHEFDKTERREVTQQEFEDALEAVLLAPKSKVKSENREPTKAELNAKWRLDRRPR